MLQVSPYAWISQYFCGFFFTYGVYLPFWGVWFEEEGVASSDIGILIGLGFATRAIANLVITPRIYKAEYLIPALRILTIVSFISLSLFLISGMGFWWMALVTILFNLSCGPAIPLSDVMANYYVKHRLLDYGRTRLWGSLSFIFASAVVGYLVSSFGSDMIVYTAIGGTTIALFFIIRRPNPMPISTSDNDNVRINLWLLLKEAPVIKFVILVSLIQGSHAAYYSFSSIYWKSSGYEESTIGYLWSLGVVSEVLVFALSRYLFSGWKVSTLFIIAAIGVMVRWGLSAVTTELFILIIVQSLHGVTFAMAHLAAIQYIQTFSQNRMVALQALYNAIPLGAFMALMTSISGWGYEALQANIFWIMAVMGGLALFIKLDKQHDESRE